MRKIVHVDMDAFYAAIEQLDHPQLRGQPVIVGGLGRRGVVSTASYEARQFGVHSAMPMAQARRLCPHAIFLSPRFPRYCEASEQIRQVLYSYTPLVEPLSLDEAFLDLTGVERLFGPAVETARKIKQRIFAETGLTCSIGVAPNKFLAKLASDLEKPDGFVVVRAGEEFLKDLSISRLWGVGKGAARQLRGLGVSTIGQLRELPLERLLHEFGRFGQVLYNFARGIDPSPVVPEREARSIGQERTFAEDISDREVLKRILFKLSEEVGRRLRAAGLQGKTVQIKVRFADFTTITRTAALARPTDLGEGIYEEIERLFAERVQLRQGVRLLGVRVSGLVAAGQGRLPLFPDEERSAELERLVDELRERFGEDALKWGRSL